MSQSSTWDTLMVARDARLSGHPDVELDLMREVDEGLPAYSHLFHRKVARRGDRLSGVDHGDWLAWIGTHVAARRESVMSSRAVRWHVHLDDTLAPVTAQKYVDNLREYFDRVRERFGNMAPVTIFAELA